MTIGDSMAYCCATVLKTYEYTNYLPLNACRKVSMWSTYKPLYHFRALFITVVVPVMPPNVL